MEDSDNQILNVFMQIINPFVQNKVTVKNNFKKETYTPIKNNKIISFIIINYDQYLTTVFIYIRKKRNIETLT